MLGLFDRLLINYFAQFKVRELTNLIRLTQKKIRKSPIFFSIKYDNRLDNSLHHMEHLSSSENEWMR
jgi:hypothetical protein